LFKKFDRNSDNEVDYVEVLRVIRGAMNPYRKDFVIKAFKKVDRDGSGILDINDIKGTYNAKLHPDVKTGKKTEEEVLMEFLDTFEVHHAMANPNDRDGKVT
jgi:Ca2+-binding EF-hand superfamily protein